MQEEIEDAWEAARMAAQEPGWLHEVLTQNGVPEQIPPFKTGRAPAKARVLFLAAALHAMKREFDAAIEFHQHALDVTYPCLPLGKPDHEPDRWTAIAHRMAELESALAAERKRREEAEGLLREVAESGLAYNEPRCPYVGLQIDRETWAEVQRFTAASPAPQPEACRCGYSPVESDRCRAHDSAPPAGDGVREAAEKLARTVLAGCKEPNPRACILQTHYEAAVLLGLLDAAKGGAR